MLTSDDPASPGMEIPYTGRELELFAGADIWHAYWQAQITTFIGGRVLEVGAGLGTVARSFNHPSIERWLALEPDPVMANRLVSLCRAGILPLYCQARLGTTSDLRPDDWFDTVLYIDVLEHIQDDRTEIARVAGHIDKDGTLIVLAPAHQFLYSQFDASIGHFRRYSLRTLLDLNPPGLSLVCARYLDSVGLLASLGNRFLLRESVPTPAQIRVWDKVLVRASRWIDPIVGFHVGKSALVVWRKP